MLRRNLHLRALGVIIAMMTMALTGGLNGTAATQGTAGTTMDFYGYFADSGSSTILLGQARSTDPTFAAELVSPQYADDFFSGFELFTNYHFASDLGYTYIDQIDEADEYMVFAGNLDSYNGVQPGYVIFLSTSQQVFVIIGYQVLINDLFGLAALTIQQGTAPQQYAEFTRIKVSDDGTLEPQSGQGTSNQTAGSSSNRPAGSGSNQPAASGNEFCYVEPNVAPLDLNDDQRLTIVELEFWVDVVPEAQGLIDTMKAQGFDSVRYAGC
jgi:hypothetical protein